MRRTQREARDADGSCTANWKIAENTPGQAPRLQCTLPAAAAAYMLMIKKITVIKIASQTRDSAKYNVTRLISSKSSPGHSVSVDLSQELYPHASISVIGNIRLKRTVWSRPATKAESSR
jgi:hypothetical protein